MPTVSVVMGVYNGAAHLAETLNSVLSQQGCDFEFIVIDDGSTDTSAQILDDYAARDPRLRVVHQENTGLTRALIRGCDMARGEFIARQDAGDLSLPGRLVAQVEALRADHAIAFVSCGSRYVESQGEFLYRQSGTGYACNAVAIIDIRAPHGVLDGPSHHGSVMFRRDRYFEAGGYREQFYFGQDWDLWYRLGMLGTFQLLPLTLYQARVGVADISTSNKSIQESLGQLSLEALRQRLDGQTDTAALTRAAQIVPNSFPKSVRGKSKRVAQGCYFVGECLRQNGSLTKARSYFWEAIRNDRLHLRAWVRLLQIHMTVDGDSEC